MGAPDGDFLLPEGEFLFTAWCRVGDVRYAFTYYRHAEGPMTAAVALRDIHVVVLTCFRVTDAAGVGREIERAERVLQRCRDVRGRIEEVEDFT